MMILAAVTEAVGKMPPWMKQHGPWFLLVLILVWRYPDAINDVQRTQQAQAVQMAEFRVVIDRHATENHEMFVRMMAVMESVAVASQQLCAQGAESRAEQAACFGRQP